MLSNYMIFFWSPPDPGDRKYAHHERWADQEDWQDFILLTTIFFSAWAIYWCLLHYIDHWTFNFIPWYVEIFSMIPVIAYFMCSEEYGANPFKWWPMFYGYVVECKTPTIIDEKELKKLGGPYRVYQINIDTLKFRTKKDAFRYTMFY